MTRAMVVQVLYNQVGRPEVSGDTKFSDVSSDEWYAKAVRWATDNGVTNGTSETTFSPEANVTREQFATFLYNKMGKPSVSGSLSNFPDEGNVSGWAYNALLWANRNGIVNGSAENGVNYLRPQRSASRAEAAQMLSNYLDATGGHSYQDSVTKAATCTATGVLARTCSVCGKSTASGTDALGHDYQETVAQEATCTTEGSKTVTCSRCGNSYTETIPATGNHSYRETSREDATCTEDGKITYVCNACGDTKTETLSKTSHQYETVVTKEATCEEDGSQNVQCKNCGYIESTETIDALGHSMVRKWAYDTPATCTEWNYYLYMCERCGWYSDFYKEDINDPSTWFYADYGHDYQLQTHQVYGILKGYNHSKVQCLRCFQWFDDAEAWVDHIDEFSATEISEWTEGNGELITSGKRSGYEHCLICDRYMNRGKIYDHLEEKHNIKCLLETETTNNLRSGFGGGYGTYNKEPIYEIVDESDPNGQWITIDDGYQCTKCGRWNNLRMADENYILRDKT